MFQIVQMISLCFSVLAAVAAAAVLVRAFRFLELLKEQARKGATLEGGKDG